MGNKQHIGSDFDGFLKEEGIFEDCDRVARKRVLAFQIEQELKKEKIYRIISARKSTKSEAKQYKEYLS